MSALERLLALPEGPATTNRQLDSDLAMSAILALAAAESAAWNVRVNLPHVADEARRAAYGHAVEGTVEHMRQARSRIDTALA
jgi:formiminotetrahydrofolate cyclodeaminase